MSNEEKVLLKKYKEAKTLDIDFSTLNNSLLENFKWFLIMQIYVFLRFVQIFSLNENEFN